MTLSIRNQQYFTVKNKRSFTFRGCLTRETLHTYSLDQPEEHSDDKFTSRVLMKLMKDVEMSAN